MGRTDLTVEKFNSSKYTNHVSQPELTAIIPVTRMAGKLSHFETLLIECTLLGIEVVIVHDKQDNETGGELDSILHSVNSNLVTLVTESVFSPGKARNLGIEKATGAWICFWDSDDNPFPEKLLDMVRQADINNYQIAIGAFRKISSKRKKTYGTSEVEIGRMPGLWRFTFKKEIIQKTFFPKYRMGEDQIFLARLNPYSEDIFHFEKVVYEYIIGNSGQLTKNIDAIRDLQFGIIDLCDLILSSKRENKIILIFFAKQVLTILKYGTPKLRLKLAFIVYKIYRKYGNKFILLLLDEFIFAIKVRLNIGEKN